MAAHVGVKRLMVRFVRHDAVVLNAMLDAAFARRVAEFELEFSDFGVDNVPALERLLQCGSLSTLKVQGLGSIPDDSHAGQEAFIAALRGNTSLTDVTLTAGAFLPDMLHDPELGTAMIEALQTLPALRHLSLYFDATFWGAGAGGRALDALLATAPSLRSLDVPLCSLGDDGLAALLDGLAANTQLRELKCDRNGASEVFQRERLVPALAALAARGAPAVAQDPQM